MVKNLRNYSNQRGVEHKLGFSGDVGRQGMRKGKI